jgi:lysophospholipase L1-like esterase
MKNYRYARIALLTLTTTFLFSTFSTGQENRRNIGAFFDKIRAGKPVTVAYFGGSITAGAGASDANKTSYRALVTSWLRSRFPQAQITELNAGANGTGSAYGSIRARRDVIAHKPDLVFLEFTLNDVHHPEDAVKRSLEGVIRQFLSVPQPPEIVMLYPATPARDPRVEWHEAIAKYYAIPIINLHDLIQAAAASGKITKATFGKDGICPLDEGHKLYAGFMTAFLAEQENLKSSSPIKVFPPALVSDEMTYGELRPFAEVKHGAEWRTEPISDRTLPAALLVSDKAGAQIEIVFEGTAVGFTYRLGPDGGMIECLIDGKPAPAPLAQVDSYKSKSQVGTQIIAGGLLPGEHKLTIRVIGEKNAKSSGHQIRLGYLLVGGLRPDRL